MKTSKFFLMALLALLPLSTVAAAGTLSEYVNLPDDSYAFEVVSQEQVGETTAVLMRMTSQTWQDIVWEHWLSVIRPAEVVYPENMVLIISGGSTSSRAPSLEGEEAKIMNLVATQTKSAIGLISQVPNQPLFGGKSEDEIIAYTYDKYLNGEGEYWPLLLPMAKSAVRAMDTLQTVMKERFQQDVKGFVLTGGSKRGWTSWLAAASGDERVKGIAPVVIDMLNLAPQMKHQLACYNEYSNQVADYTRLGIQERMNTPAGKRLLDIVDPYSYRDSLSLPKLVILGTNDPYWTVDAANFYFPGLKAPKYLCYQPNTGHDVTLQGVSSLAHFFLAVQKGESYPEISWTGEGGQLEVRWDKPGGTAYLWQAQSPDRDFRESAWLSTVVGKDGKAVVDVETPAQGWTAFYVEVRWPGELGGFSLNNCTQMRVVPDTLPYAKTTETE